MAKNIFKPGVAAVPSHEEIAQRAHEIWEAEGRPEGRAMEHWLRAVSELKARSDGPAHGLTAEKSRTGRRSSSRVSQTRFQTADQ